MKKEQLPQIDSVLLSKYVLASTGQMNHMKLQKLLYYIQAWHLVFFEQPLFEDDFEAWLHGPLTRKVWNTYRDYSILWNTLTINSRETKEIKKKVKEILSKDQLEMIKDVLAEYGDKSAYHLESLTHSEQPWIKARKGKRNDEPCSRIISIKSMAKYYSGLLESSNE
jgi:uncharacterized phage-associated protein